MNTVTDRPDIYCLDDAEFALKEISKCRKELKRITGDSAKAIMLIKECAESEEMEIKERIKEMECRLKKFAEKNSEERGTEISIPVADGVIGFRKKIRYRPLREKNTIRSMELQIKCLSNKESFFQNAGVKLKRKNLNKLSSETLKRLGLCREENIEFFYRIDGFKSKADL